MMAMLKAPREGKLRVRHNTASYTSGCFMTALVLKGRRMLVPEDTQEFNVEASRTTVLALMAFASFMVLTAGLMILNHQNDRASLSGLTSTVGAVPEGMADKRRRASAPVLIR
jgi:hypothetical protein